MQEPPLPLAGSLTVPSLGDKAERDWPGCNCAPGLAGAVGEYRSCGATPGQLDSPCPCSKPWWEEPPAPPPHPCLASPTSPAQKLVFNRVNGKRPQVLLQQVSAPEECYTLAHEENVRFVYEGEGRGSLGTGTRLLLHPRGGAWSTWGPF